MRRSFTLFSIVVHAVAISAAFIVQVLAVGTLPTPHQPLMFDVSRVMAVDVQLPAPPRRAPKAQATNDAVSMNAAPTVAPDRIRDETGLENVAAPPAGSVIGVERGLPGVVERAPVAAAAPPPPEPPAPIRLHSGMKAPRKIVEVAPVYPAIARAAHVQGVVILEAVLDAKGGVESVRVLRSIPLLDQAAIDAVHQWRFTPALLNGDAVPVVMTITVNFTLQEA